MNTLKKKVAVKIVIVEKMSINDVMSFINKKSTKKLINVFVCHRACYSIIKTFRTVVPEAIIPFNCNLLQSIVYRKGSEQLSFTLHLIKLKSEIIFRLGLLRYFHQPFRVITSFPLPLHTLRHFF